MFNIQLLILEIELVVELQELRTLGFTEDEVCGFIETFCENWFDKDTVVVNRGKDD
jgi:hypothetical protein